MKQTVYKIHPKFTLENRQWPDNSMSSAPRWSSLDLYLGQQSLLNPMSVHQKLRLFDILVEVGFKEISISNPGASENNLLLLNALVGENLIPDDVRIQVTFPCNSELITKSIPLLNKIKNLNLQLEVPCSDNFIQLNFDLNSREFKTKALNAATTLKQQINTHLEKSNIQYSLSLEDFMGADKKLLLEIAHEITNIWLPSTSPLIIHLPNTMDYGSPANYADGFEWFIKNFKNADKSIFSTFSKNNRGNAVANCELALQAGATRVEGSLLGIGERAGNNDLIIMALNMHCQNIKSNIEIKHIDKLIETIQETTRILPPVRHPYSGDLSFTALSPGQQNIIYKGLHQFEHSKDKVWDVPYLNLNPADVGRVYESVKYQTTDESDDKLINMLTNNFGFHLPKLLAGEFSNLAKEKFSNDIAHLSPNEVRDVFMDIYTRNRHPIELKSINFEKAAINSEEDQLHCQAVIEFNGISHELNGTGEGALDTLVNAFSKDLNLQIDVASFYQNALTHGSNALAATYVKVVDKDAKGYWGVGIDGDSTLSAIKAFFNAVNRCQLH